VRDLIQVRRNRVRGEQRQRVAALVTVPMSPEARALSRSKAPGRGEAVVLCLLGALVLHSGIVGYGWMSAKHPRKHSEEVKMVVVERKKEPPPPPPEPPKVDEPPPKAPEPPKKVATAPPPPKTVDEPPPPPKPMRVTGLSLENTVPGGDGPAFATGNTNQGQTDTKAVDPKDIPATPGPVAPGPPTPEPGPNRAASNMPGHGTVVRVPKRVQEVKPAYPEVLRAQGVEADVVLLVAIDATGQVTNVKVLQSAGQPEFDNAAVAAARAERYEPATRDGAPFAYNLKYTVRFRLDNP